MDANQRMAVLHYYAYHAEHPYRTRLAQQKLRELLETDGNRRPLTAIAFDPEGGDLGETDDHWRALRGTAGSAVDHR